VNKKYNILKKNIKITIKKKKNNYTNNYTNKLIFSNKIFLEEKRKILFKNIDKNNKNNKNKYQILSINYLYNKVLLFISKYKLIIILLIIIFFIFIKIK
jgi:hypothetical protein